MADLRAENGMLVLTSRYDAGLVAAIKSLPATDRKYDPARKAWLVAPQHGAKVADWCLRYLNEMVWLPKLPQAPAAPELRTLEVRYIGTCKERTPGEFSAFGFCEGDWSVIFPETTLREWFEGKSSAPGHTQSTTLYGVLGVRQEASAEEVKAAFRRMAKHTHPDVNKEPDATEQFKRINEAYQILSNPNTRARYDAGLTLEATLKQQDRYAQPTLSIGYRSPLRCGLILAEGRVMLGRFNIEKIVMWEDITNAYGQTLSTSWAAGAKQFTETWI